MSDDARYARQLAQFENLRRRVEKILERFGQRDSFFRDGDFSMVDDYWGYPQVKVSIHNLNLLRPNVVSLLRRTVGDFPGWEIVLAVAVRGHFEDWPTMGLYVRPHEIVDGLQRQYFPEELRDLHYEGARAGTESD